MLYYLYKKNYINNSLVQHRVFEKAKAPDIYNFFDYKDCVEDLPKETREIVVTDYDLVKRIDKDIPIKSSEYEKNLLIDSNNHIVFNNGEHHISNEPIDKVF